MKPLKIHSSCQIPNLAEIYRRHFDTDDGFFVEVGAFDGFVYSNTYCLAEIGWGGLYLDPLPLAIEMCRKRHANHPKVTVQQIAAHSHRGQIKLYTHGEVSSTVWDQNSKDWGCMEDKFVMAECDQLDNILPIQRVPVGFELAVIDVEGAEIEVLKGFSLNTWQPKMVIIEAHEKDQARIRNWKAEPINQHFAAFGYTKIQADHINSIFVRK